jgi:hypothetical protein
VTAIVTVLVWSELGPTMTSKIPGSTTLCMSTLSIERVRVMVNSTVFFSPGFSVIRWNP